MTAMTSPLGYSLLIGNLLLYIVQVLGWNVDGTIVFDEVLCANNSAENHGGCVYAFGGGIFNDGTEMLNNSADRGGSICECIAFVWVSQQ